MAGAFTAKAAVTARRYHNYHLLLPIQSRLQPFQGLTIPMRDILQHCLLMKPVRHESYHFRRFSMLTDGIMHIQLPFRGNRRVSSCRKPHRAPLNPYDASGRDPPTMQLHDAHQYGRRRSPSCPHTRRMSPGSGRRRSRKAQITHCASCGA
jgi:hypothetical protein